MATSPVRGGPGRRWTVYILRCADTTLYTGITCDLEQRLAAHGQGKGARYTRGRGPLQLVYQEELDSKGEALRRERAIKRLSRQRKLALLHAPPEDERLQAGTVPIQAGTVLRS